MSKNVNRKLTPKGKIVRRLGANVFGNAKYDKLLGKSQHLPEERLAAVQNSPFMDFSFRRSRRFVLLTASVRSSFVLFM